MSDNGGKGPKGGRKITRALKSAAMLPVKGLRAGTGRRTTPSFNPQPGEEPAVILRLQVIGSIRESSFLSLSLLCSSLLSSRSGLDFGWDLEEDWDLGSSYGLGGRRVGCFVVASILNNRNQTPVAKKTLNPTYTPKDATFDFPLYLSLADKLGVLELVVWDKDIVGKDYLGEVGLPLDEWFVERVQGAEMKERPFGWEDSGNKASG
ncbi:hypothetical protein CC1G_09043 [Coprinopsis cinerea okayama7|uniref:C2 domain-containing protein n=1 Tax=Coprinopsis cinerea (strain Okayama-7 / 130 / ATCC MYA-4618 / FGSC 9003) TaxID=240176 RepID=A8P2W9_COPC7|nr:hypothetical protein CC1G_09043 [Coprinopsis cinerea okayama7\|eukprot:XP_001838415.2 hypothetical protein CC1G_09043 [Coprinopsis cinerea okayama7\